METLDAIQLLITALVAIAAVTPTEKDDKVIGRFKNLLDKVKKIIMRFQFESTVAVFTNPLFRHSALFFVYFGCYCYNSGSIH